ncbi:hypothetical protein CcrC1_gp364 [Caulobacter phage C1]|nr:hypothetical protein CcrC1_gp364 [Caulobacter phage C1]UTU08593.1 hypothetical protein CcrC2_gp365 [Caulobacter phage C2]UTU09109.1 hypothetical protein CcrJ4_gp360 [Caulobacter phage J4]UTU10226.1 hypothetical protein CcrRB23_gp364 [Caulobacter phage RB23]WGN97260.1 hypothetical protein [Bertelyvirus sp.]
MTDPENRDYTVCYLLMRTDLKSLCAGKAMAQAHHAALQMEQDAKSWTPEQQEVFARYRTEAKGFGTTIVLGVTAQEMRAALIRARDLGYNHAVVNDPEYPLMDGGFLHHIPLDTCAYVFGEKRFVENAVIKLDLLRRASLWQPAVKA